jgi:hypothetical protein
VFKIDSADLMQLDCLIAGLRPSRDLPEKNKPEAADINREGVIPVMMVG